LSGSYFLDIPLPFAIRDSPFLSLLLLAWPSFPFLRPQIPTGFYFLGFLLSFTIPPSFLSFFLLLAWPSFPFLRPQIPVFISLAFFFHLRFLLPSYLSSFSWLGLLPLSFVVREIGSYFVGILLPFTIRHSFFLSFFGGLA
jgi:hypothetical protein